MLCNPFCFGDGEGGECWDVQGVIDWRHFDRNLARKNSKVAMMRMEENMG